MNQSLKLTVGLPGSGKTTWAKSWVSQDPSKRIRVSRDDIRAMLGPNTLITNQREALISIIESTAVRNALKRGYDVVIDAHHLNPKVVAKWNAYVDMINAKDGVTLDMEFVNMNTPLDVCISRDSSRPGDEQVGKEVIMKLYDKYLKKEETKYYGIEGDTRKYPIFIPQSEVDLSETDMEW